MRFSFHHGIGIVGTSLVLLAGCGESGPKTVPVYGNVKFADREAPPVCELIFQPIKVDGPKRPSVTDLQKDGHYQVKAFKNSYGLIPGTYHVQLVFHDLKPGMDPKKDANWNTTNYDGGDVNVEANSSGVEYNIDVRHKS